MNPIEPPLDQEITPIALTPSVDATWAVLCGGIASGRWAWEGAALFRVLAAWLVVDVLLGCVLAQLAALKRVPVIESHAPDIARQRTLIPYATMGSLGWRLGEHLSFYRDRWQTYTWPMLGRPAITALAGIGIALVLGTYMGREMLAALAIYCLAMAGLALATGRGCAAFVRWSRAGQIALAWGMGHLAWGAWRAGPFGLGILMALFIWAHMRQGQGQYVAVRRFMTLLWGIVIAILLAARQPIVAAVLATIALSEHLIADENVGVSRISLWGWRSAMLLAAAAMTYWSY